MKDLRGWAAIAPNLFIWDYIVDYAQYLAPWPNFQVLAPNIRTFIDNKAIGVFEEAHFSSRGGEFEEMKSWVVNQLLWNPNQNTDALVKIFITGYYGKAAPRILDYYYLCQSLVKPEVHIGIFTPANHEVYNDEFIYKAFEILDDAYRLAENAKERERVERVRMQPLFLYCMRHKDLSKQDGRWDELVTLMNKYETRPSASLKLEDFEKSSVFF